MRRALDGVLLLDKTSGASSNAALQEAKRLYRASKAGHAGTLDPLASGLLPLLFGEATKFAHFALESPKEYLAVVRLGVATSTGDAEGEVIARGDARIEDASIAAALARFRGEIEQIPPMHSALKRDGTPLYRLARKGLTVERAPRRVTIHALDLLHREGEELRLRVRVSKGTYVRQLAVDLGETLGTVAHLSALRRTAVGPFLVEQGVTLEALRGVSEAERDALLLPVEAMLVSLPSVGLEPEQARRFVHGQAVSLAASGRGRCRVIDAGDAVLLGVGLVGENGELRPERLLARSPRGGASG